MKINLSVDATVKEVNTMVNPSEQLVLPTALLRKIVAAVYEANKQIALAKDSARRAK